MEPEVKGTSEMKSATIENIIEDLPVPAMMLDASWNVLRINRSVIDLMGDRAKDAIGTSFSDFLGETLAKGDMPFPDIVKNGKISKVKGRSIIYGPGWSIPVVVTATPIFDDDNILTGGVIILTPEASMIELGKKVDLYEHVLYALPWPLSVTDMEMNRTFPQPSLAEHTEAVPRGDVRKEMSRVERSGVQDQGLRDSEVEGRDRSYKFRTGREGP